MVTRRPTSSQFKKTSQRMQHATIKNSLPNKPSSRSSRRANASSRGVYTAQHGEIHQVLPNTKTRESNRAYANRINRRDYVERSVHRGRRHRIVLAIVLVIVALIIACIAAGFVFMGSLNSRLALPDSDALSEVLAIDDDAEGSAEYSLLAASFDDSSSIEMVALVRTDTTNNQATLITMPGDVLDADEEGTLSDDYAQNGDAGLVTAVENLAGVEVSHYAYTDAEGFVALVEALGGIEVTLDSDVSDPQAGDITLSAGTQTLSGEQALFLCRANDFDDPDEGRAQDIALVASGLFSKVSDAQGLNFYLKLDHWADHVKTDMSPRELSQFVSSLRTLDTGNLLSGAMPTQITEVNGKSAVVVEADAWENMMDRVGQGLTPLEDVEDVVSSIDPSSFSITVNNGGGIDGAAAEAAQILADDGLDVESIGNADMQVYEETLVIYADDEFAEDAEAIVALLGQGRTVWDSVHYSFSTDILVVIGSNWESSD